MAYLRQRCGSISMVLLLLLTDARSLDAIVGLVRLYIQLFGFWPFSLYKSSDYLDFSKIASQMISPRSSDSDFHFVGPQARSRLQCGAGCLVLAVKAR